MEPATLDIHQPFELRSVRRSKLIAAAVDRLDTTHAIAKERRNPQPRLKK